MKDLDGYARKVACRMHGILMESKSIYICEFEFKGQTLQARSDKGSNMFKDGFWINDKLKYAFGIGAKFWIPPHKISYIEVVRCKITKD